MINLIIQYVNDSRPARQSEYDECIRRNLANPHVKAVHNLQERVDVLVPNEFKDHGKYRQRELGKWMTYGDAFEYARSALSGEICAVINLDIFLDDKANWPLMRQTLQQKIVFCLSRTEFNPNGTSFRDPFLKSWAFANSQDAWMFRAPLENVNHCDFCVGTLGCDNAIAHRIKQAGYLPVNAPQQFKIFHLDRVRGKTLQNQYEIYARERKSPRCYPEREGQYLLPDIDMIRSVDQLLQSVNATDLQRYEVICDVFNKFIKLRSPKIGREHG
jgi:hypothetical protein